MYWLTSPCCGDQDTAQLNQLLDLGPPTYRLWLSSIDFLTSVHLKLYLIQVVLGSFNTLLRSLRIFLLYLILIAYLTLVF